MVDEPDLYYIDTECANGNSIVQIHRWDMYGANRKLSPEERRALLHALEQGDIREIAEKLGLRYMNVMYRQMDDGFKATVLL
jgi:hypothetical protein